MRWRRPVTITSAVAVAAFSLLAAGCGGGSSPAVANVASTTTGSTTPTSQSELLAFSNCMRSHGMPNFPDPEHFAGGNVKLTLHDLNGSSPQFRTALDACNQLLPTNGGGQPQQTAQQRRTQLADALSFARCMRSHGLSRFPDPTPQGRLTVEMVEAQGIDVHSASVLRVVQKCLPASHGALTPAKIRQSLSNAGG